MPDIEEAQTEGAVGMRMICPACNRMFDADIFVCDGCGSGLLEIPDAPVLSGRLLDDRYDVGEVIGTGGMGTVYRARQRGMERDVAIKVLHPHYAHQPKAVKRFFREAQAASRLVHPNIITVYDFGRSFEGHLYMVMELLEGWTLGDLIHYRAPLSPSVAIAISAQICDALAEAHRRRLVHRDLKPDNVLVCTTSDGLWAKVLDFGIARALRDPDTSLSVNESTVEIAGTPSYMSPEQILGKAPDTRSDLYALGIIIFEMLTKGRPFDDDNSVALCMKQLNEPPPHLTATRPGLDALDDVVQRLLSKKPELRPQHAEDVRRMLLACPQAQEPAELPAIDVTAPRALSTRTTRGDAGLLMEAQTLDASGGASQRQDLGEILARGGRAADLSGMADLAIPERGPRTHPVPPVIPGAIRPSTGPVRAIAHLLVDHPGALKRGPIADWLDARERRGGWQILREAQLVVLRLMDTRGAVRHVGPSLARELVSLQKLALDGNVALRVGVAVITDDYPAARALDLSRRLAAGAAHGGVAVPSSLAAGIDLPGRPQTGLFLPDGSQVQTTMLHPAARPGGGPVLLWGRSVQLRRLGQLADEARRTGPVRAVVTGPAGSGKTALLRAFTLGRRNLRIRVSPAADHWPGHTVARLLAATMGICALRGREQDLAGMALPGRAGELLELLISDREGVEPPTIEALARLVADRLASFAEDGPLAVIIDDAQHLDAASQQILEAALAGDQSRPWCVVAAARYVGRASFLADGHRIELRPLSLRASNALLESLGVPPRGRHGLMAAAQGNPLALHLLARALETQPKVPMTDVVRTLLPEELRGLAPADADRAWLAAALGEGEEDLGVHAARLYLAAGLAPELSVWLSARLTALGPVPAAIVRGLVPSAAGDDAAPQGVLVRAARSARLGLWRDAAQAYETASQAAPAGARAPQQLRAAQMRAHAGDVRGAVAAYDASVRSGGAARRPTELLHLVQVLLQAGANHRAGAILDDVDRELAAVDSPRALGESLALRARAALQGGDRALALSHLTRARASVEGLKRKDAHGARRLEALTQQIRAELAVSEGDRDSARVNFRQAQRTFRDLGRHSDALRCLIQLGQAEIGGPDGRAAVNTFKAAHRLAEAGGYAREAALAEVGLGEALLTLGEVDAGTAPLRRVLRAARDSDPYQVFALAALGMADAMSKKGLWADALRYAERAAKASGPPSAAARAKLAEGVAWRGLGQEYKAQQALAQARDLALATGDGLLVERVAVAAGHDVQGRVDAPVQVSA